MHNKLDLCSSFRNQYTHWDELHNTYNNYDTGIGAHMSSRDEYHQSSYIRCNV